MENGSSERLRNLPKVTQLMSGEAWIQTRVSLCNIIHPIWRWLIGPLLVLGLSVTEFSCPLKLSRVLDTLAGKRQVGPWAPKGLSSVIWLQTVWRAGYHASGSLGAAPDLGTLRCSWGPPRLLSGKHIYPHDEFMPHKIQEMPRDVHMWTCLFIWDLLLQSLSRAQLFATPWTAARQASLSITDSQSLLKLMSIELVMPSNHLILCRPLLLLPSIFPSIRVFSNELLTLHIRWPKYWTFSFSMRHTGKNQILLGLWRTQLPASCYSCQEPCLC